MIDEKKLIEEITKYHNGLKPSYITRLVESIFADIVDIINEQPKVNEWIPVSEDMPRLGERVLCSLNLDNPTIIHPVVISTRNTDKYWYDGTIVAWQPLPEPYKGE